VQRRGANHLRWLKAACAAIASGEMKQQDVVDRVSRSMGLLMDAGLFDPVAMQSYTKIPLCAHRRATLS
jgi:hypothetical protein